MEGKLCRERHGFDHHRRNSPVLPQSVWRSVGSNVMVTWFGCLVFDGQRHCLAHSFIADSSLSWVVVSPSSVTWMCSGLGMRLGEEFLAHLRSCCTCFEHDDCRMRSLANFTFFSETIQQCGRWQPGSPSAVSSTPIPGNDSLLDATDGGS